MLTVTYAMYEPLISPLLMLFSYWVFFLKNNFFFLRKQPLNFDKMRSINFLKKTNYKLLINFGFIFNWIYFLSFYTIKVTDYVFWWGHCFFSNINLTIMYYIVSLNLALMLILFCLKKQKLNLNVEYVFSLLNINTVIVWIFAANNLFTLIFILELISALVFYKFNVSKFWFNSKQPMVITKLTKLTPKYYINMLFFQYWTSFFSSILIFISLINLTSIYGSSDWLTLNFLQILEFNSNQLTKIEILFVLFPLFFGIFLKLGITPIHFYKIEVYKGLPLVSILFYTTYYFFIFIVFFLYFFMTYLSSFFFWSWLFLFLILASGMIYIISLLFDGYLIKSFFGYSTVINSLNLILLSLFAVS